MSREQRVDVGVLGLAVPAAVMQLGLLRHLMAVHIPDNCG